MYVNISISFFNRLYVIVAVSMEILWLCFCGCFVVAFPWRLYGCISMETLCLCFHEYCGCVSMVMLYVAVFPRGFHLSVAWDFILASECFECNLWLCNIKLFFYLLFRWRCLNSEKKCWRIVFSALGYAKGWSGVEVGSPNGGIRRWHGDVGRDSTTDQ